MNRLTEAALLAAWQAQVAIGKAAYPKMYGVRVAPDWKPPPKPVSAERQERRRKSHSRKRPI